MTTNDPADHWASRLNTALRRADEVLPVLVHLLPEPDTGGPKMGTISRSSPDGSEPWNGQVAEVLWGLWYGVGHLVNHLRISLGLRALVHYPKGPAAIDVLRNLIPVCSAEVLKLAALRAERWVRRADELPAIDESEPWTALPIVGAAPPRCPYCGTYALRMRKRAGEVMCFMPGCEDGDGRPTRARMEPGRMTGEARLIFGDGTMMTFEGDDDA